MNRTANIYYVYKNNEFVGTYSALDDSDAILAACYSIVRDGGTIDEADSFRADIID